ncbi:hypothetical protein F2Q69_00021566 [Brassica cretica]|uniref:Uncharacterized protein n=1 Tax=Brassica cretica TaxID=69181 RepID=A0A8S9QKA2_BRACR|nr:hypothetical protein F2Q69_00021566 [Brassica cretica]
MMKLAICCAAKGVGTSNTNDRPKETSCEGSSTEGCCGKATQSVGGYCGQGCCG